MNHPPDSSSIITQKGKENKRKKKSEAMDLTLVRCRSWVTAYCCASASRRHALCPIHQIGCQELTDRSARS